MKIVIVFFTITLTSCSYCSQTFGQDEDTITDFYEYANKGWLDSTSIPENSVVVNNWGILWNKIMNKSIEILANDQTYELDESYLYTLTQLQNFYKSTIEYSIDERKRVELVQKHYPMLFGIVFSKITITNDKEEKIKKIIEYITIAYRMKIKNSSKIKANAVDLLLTKIDKMEFEIGSPPISSFPIMPALSVNSLKLNIKLSEEYQLAINTVKSDWESPPFETDCRYNVNENKVKLYAGTLFDFNFTQENDFEVLFATLGRTVAHEMTHGFDKSGKAFNKDEWNRINLSLINQFNQYTIQDEYYVDGKKTLQENFADLSGLEVSLLALKLLIKENYSQYSEEEESNRMRSFFMTFAQFWREKATSEFEITSLERMHTPQKFRAIGPVYNQDEFYKLFKIDIKSKYYIPDNQRISIW